MGWFVWLLVSVTSADSPAQLWRGHMTDLEANFAKTPISEYSEDIAKGALVYSGIVYRYGNASAFANCSTGFTVTTHSSTTIKGHVVDTMLGHYQGKYIVAAFEGTDSDWQLVNEWAALGNVGFTGNSTMRVIQYWNDIATDQLDELTLGLLSLITKYPNVPVLFTGHSLGAATMTLVLSYMQFNAQIALPKERMYIYTFGQPRVGGVNFSRWYSSMFKYHWRVVHYDDVVPHVPCCELSVFGDSCQDDGKGYVPWHVSTEIWYEDAAQSKWKYCTGTPIGEDKSCAFSIRMWDYSVDDHLNYFDAHVGYMCEILNDQPYGSSGWLGDVVQPVADSNLTQDERRRQGLICIW